MTTLPRPIALTFVAGLLLAPTTGRAQRPPDLSGNWVLTEALMSGAGRDGSGAAAEGPRRTSTTTISGAALNCGTGCTIRQKGQTLTIDDAQLADFPGKDKSKPTPPVTLHIDGRRVEVIDSFSPGRQLPVTARWDGSKLSIKSGGLQSVGYTQVLSLEGGRLVVVTTSDRHGSETIFKYRRK